MLDARIQLVMLIVLTVFCGIASQKAILGIVLATVIVSLLQKDSFARGIKIIVISMLILGLFMFFVWSINPNISLFTILNEYARWSSLIIISVVLFLSMNVMEIVSSLVWFKLPLRLALSVGIALRFLHVIYEESQRVFMIQRSRGITFSYRSIKKYGFLGLLDRLVSPLLVSILRRADSISLSIVVQQIEKRIAEYKFSSLKKQDFIALCLLVVTFIALFF